MTFYVKDLFSKYEQIHSFMKKKTLNKDLSFSVVGENFFAW